MRITVTIDVEVPDELGATDKQISEWLEHELMPNGSVMSDDNPLHREALVQCIDEFDWDEW